MNPLACYQQLLSVLPIHAEEGGLREELLESEMVSQGEAGSGHYLTGEGVVFVIRRLFESLALLDPIALSKGRWAFVSFPASLMARSILETLGAPGSTFFEPNYWTQGRNRPVEVAEEQRSLLSRLEYQRTSNPDVKANPIRTVHVSWGVVRFGAGFLFHRREDKNRGDVSRYVFPGGRLEPVDLDVETRTSEALRDLFSVDSGVAKRSLARTLIRELREELDLVPSEYVAAYRRTLQPFQKIEGTLNNHAYTQYNIAIYSIELNEAGSRKVLYRIAQEPAEWEWFTAPQIVAGKRPDGKRAFVDALVRDPPQDVIKFLGEDISDSCTPAAFQTRNQAIALPSTSADPILFGTAGRQKRVPLSLDKREWELLMLLGWHARGLDLVAPIDGPLVLLGGGWIKLGSEELQDTAVGLAKKLQKSGLPLVEYDSLGLCRLSIVLDHLYFQPGCFNYFWNIESDDKPIVLKLMGIETNWANLKGQEISIRLTPQLLKAMPALQDEREPLVDHDTVRREFDRVLEPAEPMGLQQFIAWKNGAHEILVKNTCATHG